MLSAYTVDHTGFTVPDLDQAIEFFVDVLGCELSYQEGPFDAADDDTMLSLLGVHPNSRLRAATLRLGSTTAIELLEYASPGATAAPPRNHDHSAGHIAFRVRDIDAAAARLRVNTQLEVYDGPNTIEDGPSAGIRWLYFKAPWGLQLELVQLPKTMRDELDDYQD
jgi:catechol 2,3-dioxygenase-like lactoylglutathione lyase family enzyme